MIAPPATTARLMTATHDTPIGRLTLAASDTGLTRCTFQSVRTPAGGRLDGTPAARGWLDLAQRELDRYLAGQLRTFTVPVDLQRVGRPHRRVLDALVESVGYGETVTYGRLAATLGLTGDGPQQVGAAMARNPVLVIVPCHRVLGAGGRLVGYAGGLAAKQWLLDLETQDGTPQLELGW